MIGHRKIEEKYRNVYSVRTCSYSKMLNHILLVVSIACIQLQFL